MAIIHVFTLITLLHTFRNNHFTCLFFKVYFEKCISLPLIATVQFSEMQVRCQMKASLLFCRNFFKNNYQPLSDLDSKTI